MVLFSHSFPLHGLPLPVPLPGQSLGAMAVAMFFVVSGFLVSKSWVNDPDFRRYWARRLLRVYPGLLVAVVLTTVLIGSMATSLSWLDFWTHPATWSYLANNIMAIAGQHTLPGVFEHNPFANAFNASLWTLRYELLMYLLFSLLGCGVGAKHLKVAVLTIFCALAAYRVALIVQVVGEPSQTFEGWFFIHLSLKDTLEFAYFFFAGAAMNMMSLKRVSPGVVVALVAITVVTAVTLILTAFRVLHGYHTVAQVTVGYVFGTVLGWWWHET